MGLLSRFLLHLVTSRLVTLVGLMAFAISAIPVAVSAAPVLTVTPSSGPAYPFVYAIRGTGFTPGQRYSLNIYRNGPEAGPSDCCDRLVTGDAGGTFEASYNGIIGNGAHRVDVAAYDPNAGPGPVIASAEFFVGGATSPSPSASPSPSPPPSGNPLCFPGKTEFCVGGDFRRQWEQHGGLGINGYPLSERFMQKLEDGKTYEVQYFERVRMEYHPEIADPQQRVLLGQFGRYFHPPDPPAAPLPGATFFPETQHNVGGGFLAYWQANGGVLQFGFPLSEIFTEILEDGNPYQVQYFERARFEYHGQEILLGQFGRRILAEAPR